MPYHHATDEAKKCLLTPRITCDCCNFKPQREASYSAPQVTSVESVLNYWKNHRNGIFGMNVSPEAQRPQPQVSMFAAKETTFFPSVTASVKISGAPVDAPFFKGIRRFTSFQSVD